MKLQLFLSACMLTILASCATNNPVPSTESDLQITGAWARIVAPGADMSGDSGTAAKATGAVYMTIAGGRNGDRLLEVASDAAENVEMHTVTSDNGMMQMRPVSEIQVPANGTIELKPGGFHVMLIGVKPNVKAGGTISLQLTFEKAGVKNVMAQVRAQ